MTHGKNNVIAKNHFRKDWQRYVRVAFDTPAKRIRRREAREERAAAIFPRPLRTLKPVVRPSTKMYNGRVKIGRGFTMEEIKAAGLTIREARSLGVSFDHRRKNRSEESLKRNVARLKQYQSNLVIFPRDPKKPKKTDAPAEAQKEATTFKGVIMPVSISRQTRRSPVVGTISKSNLDTKKSVVRELSKARAAAKYIGVREKRAKAKKEKEALLKKA